MNRYWPLLVSALVLVTACHRKPAHPVSRPTEAPNGSAGSMLNFGERKAEQISYVISEADRVSCAKTPLMELYACQVGYYMENNGYQESLAKMSCAPYPDQCRKDWEYSLRVSNQGSEFTATAQHKASGETWSINQAKALQMTEPAKPTPPPSG